eukprot:g23355.t1
MFILFLFRSVVRFSGIKSAGMIVIAIPCLSLFVVFALVVLVLQAIFASLLWLLDRPPLRLRTGLLLNKRDACAKSSVHQTVRRRRNAIL